MVSIHLLFTALLLLIGQPTRNAEEVAQIIAEAELIGGNQYLADDALSQLNHRILGRATDVPRCTHSFETRVLSPSAFDLVMFRCPIEIEYTANPIPPAYQGKIVRHTVTCHAGLTSLKKIKHKSNVLYEYFE